MAQVFVAQGRGHEFGSLVPMQNLGMWVSLKS